MKNKAIMLSSVATLFAFATFAQSVESDDMYFNASDRVKLNALRTSEQEAYASSVKKAKKIEYGEEEYVLPTESYPARNVNPEYAARSNSRMAQEDDQDYFVNNYQYQTSSNLNNWNNSFNSWYSNPWYASNFYGPSINSYYSPYYGSAYDSWGSPWYNPYYRSGWSSSFSFYWGNSYNYGWGPNVGWGMGYAYGNPYYNSWYGYGPSYGYGYGGFYYPSNNVIIYSEGGHGNVAYGKRATRGGTVTSPQNIASTGNRTRSTYTPAGSNSTSGGRVSSNGRSQSQPDYYNRSWRNNTATQNSAYPSRSSTNNSWNNTGTNNRSSSDSYNGGGRNTYSNPSPSRSSTMSSGSSRPSAPSSSGSGGRTRGRD
jgi:hypothetical protein